MVICKDFLEALHESCAQKYRAADCTRGALQVQLIFTFLNRSINCCSQPSYRELYFGYTKQDPKSLCEGFGGEVGF
jgi:hypothetical protein